MNIFHRTVFRILSQPMCQGFIIEFKGLAGTPSRFINTDTFIFTHLADCELKPRCQRLRSKEIKSLFPDNGRWKHNSQINRNQKAWWSEQTWVEFEVKFLPVVHPHEGDPCQVWVQHFTDSTGESIRRGFAEQVANVGAWRNLDTASTLPHLQDTLWNLGFLVRAILHLKQQAYSCV
jgi:hypothetical protein